jgi:hypothetical protein
MVAPPLSNKGKPLRTVTLRSSTISKLTRINASGARSVDITKGLSRVPEEPSKER